MEKEKYQKLMSLVLNLRIAESMASELACLIHEANKDLRELLLKEKEDA